MDETQNTHADEQLDETSKPSTEPCAKCEEYLSGWKRAQADYANLKRENDRERGELVKYANERLLHELLPAIDQYEIALKYAPDLSALPEDARKKLENWNVGLRAVQSLWENAFRSIGLEKVNVNGPFDPQLHEAVGNEASTTVPKGHILRVAQDGWQLHGKLLRPAKVVVADEESST